MSCYAVTNYFVVIFQLQVKHSIAIAEINQLKEKVEFLSFVTPIFQCFVSVSGGWTTSAVTAAPRLTSENLPSLFTAESIRGRKIPAGSQRLGDGAKDGGQQGENCQAGELLAGGPGSVQGFERAVGGDPEPVRDPGQEVQQGQEAAQGLPAEVSHAQSLQTPEFKAQF